MSLVKTINIVGRYWRVSEFNNILRIPITRTGDAPGYCTIVKVFTLVENIHLYVKSKGIDNINNDKEWIVFVDFEPDIYTSESYLPILEQYKDIDRLFSKALWAGHLGVLISDRGDFIRKITANLFGKQFKLSIDGEEV